MPNYTFKARDGTGEYIIETMPGAKLDRYLKKNKHLEQVLVPLGFSDPVHLGRTKIDNGFKDMLGRIKKANRGSTIEF